MTENEQILVLQNYKREYAGKYGILAMGIFGSVARDQADESSDLDVFVETITPNPFFLAHIKQDIEQRLHKKVDIVRIRKNMNPHLKKQIDKDAVYV
jgi:predicted nucleotidyltransferase